jgi:hypothetical protein
MYNVAMHAQQILGATILSVSLSETNDEGITYPVATAMSSSNLLASADEDPLWIFLQQIKECLSSALGDETGLWATVDSSDGVDGGWGGAGQTGPTERSEDECSG